jgi:hypothetical protein
MRVWHHILSQDIIFMSHFTYKMFNIHFLIQLGTQLALEISTISPSTESIYFYGYVRLNSHLNLKYQQSLPQMWVSSILFMDMLPLKWKFFHTLAPLLWHSTRHTVNHFYQQQKFDTRNRSNYHHLWQRNYTNKEWKSEHNI